MADLQISAPAGSLQVRPSWQQGEQEFEQLALVCHPHPLFGGTMDNKVVTTLARFFKKQNMAVALFNFRGVGSSTGVHDNGVGEVDDAAAVLDWALRQTSATQLYVAGFSFGAYIAAALASRLNQQQLHAGSGRSELLKTFLVAPPVHHYPMQHLSLNQNTVVLIGDQDEVVPPAQVIQWADRLDLPVHLMPECSHFFHGHLNDLTDQLQQNFP
ncbi:alpha/beta hydrolase [Alkanindiges sp. WGS2144]|uniref:alpha/beta hydrolase n=1 Tax=Alkanindiges sp. WGS2144 TaxID=3366808 RepID=UPI003752F9A0